MRRLLFTLVPVLLSACVVSQQDLSSVQCLRAADCPPGYVCRAVSGRGVCELSFPVKGQAIDAGPPIARDWCRDIKPLEVKYCERCHEPPNPDGGVLTNTYADLVSNADAVRSQVFFQAMPDQAPFPTFAERQVILDWIDQGTPECLDGGTP